MEKYTVGSGYFDGVLEPNKLIQTVAYAQRTLQRQKWKFDVIVCQGLSGMAVSLPLGFSMKIPVVIARKSLQGTHASSFLEGVSGPWRYIIVDDFPETGNTIDNIINTVKNHGTIDSHLAGVLFYNMKHVDAEEYKWKFPIASFSYNFI